MPGAALPSSAIARAISASIVCSRTPSVFTSAAGAVFFGSEATRLHRAHRCTKDRARHGRPPAPTHLLHHVDLNPSPRRTTRSVARFPPAQVYRNTGNLSRCPCQPASPSCKLVNTPEIHPPMRFRNLALLLCLLVPFSLTTPARASETAYRTRRQRRRRPGNGRRPAHGNLPDYSLPPDKLAKAQHISAVRVNTHFGNIVWGILQLVLLLWLGVIAWMRDTAVRSHPKSLGLRASLLCPALFHRRIHSRSSSEPLSAQPVAQLRSFRPGLGKLVRRSGQELCNHLDHRRPSGHAALPGHSQIPTPLVAGLLGHLASPSYSSSDLRRTLRHRPALQ